MRLPDYSIKYKAVVLFFMALITIGGLYAYNHMGKLEDPVFTIKTAAIVTPWPGASPHEVEQQVTDVIEKAAQSADEVEHIRSISKAGISIVYVDLDEKNRSEKIQQLWDNLRRKIEAAQPKLPKGVLPSSVYDDYGDVYGIFLALTGDGFSDSELKKYAEYIQRELLLVKDVSSIQLFGVQTQTIDIETKMATIAKLGINPNAIITTLGSQNTVVDAGGINNGPHRIRVETPGDFASIDEIKKLMIQGENKEQFYLKDIADIKRGGIEPREPLMRYMGKPAVGIAISTATGANVVIMGDTVQSRIDELKKELPVGLELNRIYYQSKFVKEAISKFVVNLGQSVTIVVLVLVLLITMGLRSGLLIASGLVLSILGTLLVMLVWGIDLQRISLAALILVMGMIVDNAIVVTDGSLISLQKGFKRKKAMIKPAAETAWPLLGATVIAALAFMPIYLSPNNAGEYCTSLFQVVSVALVISWVLSMVQTPVFNYMLLKAKRSDSKENNDPYTGKFYGYYRKILKVSLRNRAAVLVLMVLLLVGAGGLFTFVPKNFFADSDKAQLLLDYWVPQGTSINKTSEDLKAIESHLATIPEIKNYTTCIGSGSPRYISSVTPEPENPSYGQIIINVHDYKTINRLIPEIQNWIIERFPDSDPKAKVHISGPSADYKVEARFSGPDPAILRQLAEEAKAIMKKEVHVRNVRDDWRQRVPVLLPSYSQKKARKAGIERNDIGNTIKGLTDGVIIGQYRENDTLLPVVFKVMPKENDLFSGFTNTPVWGGGPSSVPLGQVVDASTLGWEDPIVRRYERRRAIKAQCDTDGVTSDTVLLAIKKDVEAIPLPPGYELSWAGEYDLSTKGNAGVQKNLPLALLLMATILVFLFNGFKQPIIIALVVPLAVIGMVAGLFFSGQSFGFLAILGAYSLIGMMIKNAVVLLDQIDIEIRNGKQSLNAVIDSGISRMRPVMMASVTTILGMIPLLGDVMFRSTAVTIMSGLAFASVLTLVVVPVLYTLFYRVDMRGLSETVS
jgi:multidrug efflux pump subunit AcrB